MSFIAYLSKNPNNSYFINGSEIGAEEVVSDLGVDIDSNLKFDVHINNIIGRAYSRIGILFKGFSTRNISVLKQAYVTYIRPVLEYASNVWSPYLLKHINGIERVQKHFTKRIPLLSNLPYSERLAFLDLEPLELRRLKSDLLLYYKYMHNLIDIPENIIFGRPTVDASASNTRSGGNRLIIPFCSTNIFANNFFNRCLGCWNVLPISVRDASTVFAFKRSLDSVDLRHFLRCNYF